MRPAWKASWISKASQPILFSFQRPFLGPPTRGDGTRNTCQDFFIRILLLFDGLDMLRFSIDLLVS